MRHTRSTIRYRMEMLYEYGRSRRARQSSFYDVIMTSTRKTARLKETLVEFSAALLAIDAGSYGILSGPSRDN